MKEPVHSTPAASLNLLKKFLTSIIFKQAGQRILTWTSIVPACTPNKYWENLTVQQILFPSHSYGDKFLYQFTIVHSPAGRWADTQSSGTMYLVITQTSAGYDGSLQAQMYLGKTISSNEESSSSFSPDMVVGMVLG